MVSFAFCMGDSKHPSVEDNGFQSIPRAVVDGIPVDAFPNYEALFNRMLEDIQKPTQALICHLNVHGCNLAHAFPRLMRLYQQADTVLCDGTGIVFASKLLKGVDVPARVSASDYLPHFLALMAAKGLTAYFLGWSPDVVETGVKHFQNSLPQHSIVGWHHGYILDDPQRHQTVIDEINRLQPDVLFVGLGMPLQEFWIDEFREQLQVNAIIPLGGTLDFYSQHKSRCPQWMGPLGLEWLYRFYQEPRRMFHRYMVGNPMFMARILQLAILQRVPLAPKAALQFNTNLPVNLAG